MANVFDGTRERPAIHELHSQCRRAHLAAAVRRLTPTHMHLTGLFCRYTNLVPMLSVVNEPGGMDIAALKSLYAHVTTPYGMLTPWFQQPGDIQANP